MKTKNFPLTKIAFACTLLLANPVAWAEDQFDASLWGGGSVLGIDFARFNVKNAVLPGRYEAQIYVNNEEKGESDIIFADNPATGRAELCFTPKLQEMLDLMDEAIVKSPNAGDDTCVFASDAIPKGTFDYQGGDMKLKLELPQALTIRRPRGYIAPSRWQTGTNAAFANYDINYYRSGNPEVKSESLYVGLRGGVNFGNWALRHNGSFSRFENQSSSGFTDKGKNHYERGDTYLQRDFALLRGNVTVGDFFSTARIGENFGLRGLRIASDDRMLAPSQRGFAPVVRGVANTNAKVSIKQNGYTIYQITVPAGPFVINDLYASGYSGDLTVEIQESDGKVRSFIVPFSNLAPLMRVGHLRYQLAGGRYRIDSRTFDERVLQGVLQYGLTNHLTLNSSLLYTRHYRAGLFGFGLNTPIGAFSADATWSHAEFPLKNVSKNGYSLHGSYSINFNEIGTNLTLAAYRYSSRDFYTLSDTIGLNRTFRQFSGAYLPEIYRPKNQFQVSLSQSLGDWGNLYLSGQTYNYWEKRGTNTQYQVAYSNSFHILNYSVNLSQSIDKETGKRDNSIYLSVSLPLGDNHSADSSYSRSGNDINQRLGVNGSFGERHQWSYGINASRNNQGYRSYDANLAHNNSIGSYRASYSRDSLKNRSTSLGASGAVVAHKHGITLSQPVGESFAIIHAKDAAGAKVESGANVSLDYFGNAVMPYTSPYEINYIGINPSDAEANVEFEATERQIIPRANSISLVNFRTGKNTMVLFNLTLPNGEPVPMASTAQDSEGVFVGDVVQGGVLFANKLTQPKGELIVKWGERESEQCRFHYQVDLDNAQIQSQDIQCKTAE